MTKDSRSEIERLDRISNTYATDLGKANADLISYYTLKLLGHHELGTDVLLMGIGDGVILRGLAASESVRLTVVEASSELIKSVEPTVGKNVTLVNSLFEEYHPGAVFDSIIGTHVLEHVDDPVQIARQAKTWCRPGGKAYFTVPNADSLHRRIGVAMGMLSRREELNESDAALGHRRVYRVETLGIDLVTAGWSLLDTKGYLLKVLSNQQMKDFRREYLDAAFTVSLGLPPEYCSSLMAICLGGE